MWVICDEELVSQNSEVVLRNFSFGLEPGLKTWRRPTLPHLKMQYHQRWRLSRPSSGWDRVGHLRHNHQVVKPGSCRTKVREDVLGLTARNLIEVISKPRALEGAFIAAIAIVLNTGVSRSSHSHWVPRARTFLNRTPAFAYPYVWRGSQDQSSH